MTIGKGEKTKLMQLAVATLMRAVNEMRSAVLHIHSEPIWSDLICNEK